MNGIAGRSLMCALLVGIVGGTGRAAEPAQWPHPIPCRIQDGANPDLFVMTLGNVQTPVATGVFDPAKDQVTLNDGTIKTNYYRDVLGVTYYRPLDKSIFPLPPSGWCTWYYYYSHITATEVKRNAEWIAANLKDFGAKYVQIDDGWQGAPGPVGYRDWTTLNTQRFPDGMAAVAAHIKSLGLEPGLWIAPHGQSNPDVVRKNPNVFLLKPDGETASDTWEGRYLVDPTAPESTAYLHDLFTTLRGWGYTYFKIDGQPIVVDEYKAKKPFMKKPSDDNAGLYRDTLNIIRKAIGPESFLLGCWGTPREGAGIMNGSRTGGDIVLGWGGFQVALRPTLNFYYLHNIVWYSDPDVMLVRSPLTLDQARVWATLQGLTGQALMSSDRLMDLGEERVELMRRVYPATDIRPLDLFPTERYKRIWDLKVNHLGRAYDVVGVFNFGEDKAERTLVRWADLGLDPARRHHAFDFWNKDYLGAWAAGMVVPAAPTSCRVVTLVPDNGRIQLVSTSRHITQGWVDLVALKQNEAGDVIGGTSRVVRNDPYELHFAFPVGTNYAIRRVTARTAAGALPVRIANHQGWATAGFTAPQNGEVTWEVQFEPADIYRYPVQEPADLKAEKAGADGLDLTWREQYFLNAGYLVYLDGQLQGYTPVASFALRGLDPAADHAVQVATVWEDGRESPKRAEIKIPAGK